VASIYKQTYTEPLPNDAQLISRDGRQYARFTRKGKTVEAPVTKDGHRVIRQTRKYYAELRDENGRVTYIPLSADRMVSHTMLRDIERKAERIKNGLELPDSYRLDGPIDDLVRSFQKHLKAKGTSARQIREKSNRILRIIAACSFKRWNDISGSKVEHFLTDLHEGTDGECGRSARTVNSYLESIRHFCTWVEKEKRASFSPVAHLYSLNVNTDRRHVRRALTIEQCRSLLAVTKHRPDIYHMSGAERALMYRVALESGIRANEIKTITVGRCHLDTDPPTMTVIAGYRKQRKERIQPIPRNLAKVLKDYIGNRRAKEPLFPNMPGIPNLSKMIRRDLAAANIPYKDVEDRVVDFHALRHTYATNLARAGVHPKVAMDLLGHSDINLTMAYYSHTEIKERGASLENLPTLDEDSDKAVGR
jgi:site-specific recombinase XerD